MFKPGPITLQRGALRLQPMVDQDIPWLVELARQNEQALAGLEGAVRPDWYRQALAEQAEGRALVFTVRLAEQIVGTSRYAGFMPHLPALELTGTWLDGEQHGTGLNTMIKHLMLTQAFAAWRMVRVQLSCAASDLRAQRSIEKLGAYPEGLLRNHRRLADGRLDDTLVYSITDEEWPTVRQRLESAFR